MAHGNIIDGLHLIVDGNVSDPSLFAEENLKQMFEELVQALDMQLIHGPIFKDVELDASKLSGNAFQDEGGISGYAMISTSHMSIHCWPLRQTFMADLFSCKMFNHDKAMGILDKFLKPSGLNVRAIVRCPAVVI
jgi:S-adenosylmethionine decarboxylase